jgi:translation initiation factor IF-3
VPIANIELRINEHIRVSQVRLINESGENVGVIEVKEALAMATEAGLDLVEVAPDAEPPVCRILDYGKHKYHLKKKQHQSHVRQRKTQLKALRMSPVIEEHDIQVKLRSAREFLARGDRVTFNMMFRGRQASHSEIGRQVFQRVATDLQDVAKVEVAAKMEGRRLWMVVAPKQSAGG